jgi:Uma2 family endonuclease
MVAQRVPQPQYMTVDEWREMERQSKTKHEYFDGQVYAMAGGTLDHSFVAVNVVALLNRALGRRPCRAYNSDAAARLSPTCFTYPDATVTCDEQDRGRTTEIQTPHVIVEVLSDSTEARDRGMKFEYYRACPSVQEYALVSTRRQLIEVYRRTPEGWMLHIYGPGDEVEFTSIDVHLPVAAIYEGTDVPEIMVLPKGVV